jgi:hypothetical protein
MLIAWAACRGDVAGAGSGAGSGRLPYSHDQDQPGFGSEASGEDLSWGVGARHD